MARTVYYDPDFAARGGPVVTTPVNVGCGVERDNGAISAWAADSCAIALAGRPDGTWYIVHVHTGDVYASAETAAELVPWLSDYADAVDDEAQENGID